MSFGTDVLGAVTEGSTVTVETAVSPPVSVGLSQSGEPSVFMKLLRPRVTVQSNGQTVATYSPYGEPSEIRPFVLVGLLTVILLIIGWRVSK